MSGAEAAAQDETGFGDHVCLEIKAMGDHELFPTAGNQSHSGLIMNTDSGANGAGDGESKSDSTTDGPLNVHGPLPPSPRVDATEEECQAMERIPGVVDGMSAIMQSNDTPRKFDGRKLAYTAAQPCDADGNKFRYLEPSERAYAVRARDTICCTPEPWPTNMPFPSFYPSGTYAYSQQITLLDGRIRQVGSQLRPPAALRG
jgi:hypothetical protein